MPAIRRRRSTQRAPVPPESEVRLVLEDRVELPRLYLAWHSAGLFADGDAEMDLIAEILAGSKTSRLYRALVYDQRIATEIAASQNSREIGGFFQIVATAAPGRTLEELEAAIARELAAFIAAGPTPTEMERCLAQSESHFIYRLQTVGGFGGKSDQLNAYNVFLGDPDYFDQDLDRYRQASPADLQDRSRARAAACAPHHPQRRPARPSGPRARGFDAGVGGLMPVDRSQTASARPRAGVHLSRISPAAGSRTGCACGPPSIAMSR